MYFNQQLGGTNARGRGEGALAASHVERTTNLLRSLRFPLASLLACPLSPIAGPKKGDVPFGPITGEV